jgi:hypothetical protein
MRTCTTRRERRAEQILHSACLAIRSAITTIRAATIAQLEGSGTELTPANELPWSLRISHSGKLDTQVAADLLPGPALSSDHALTRAGFSLPLCPGAQGTLRRGLWRRIGVMHFAWLGRRWVDQRFLRLGLGHKRLRLGHKSCLHEPGWNVDATACAGRVNRRLFARPIAFTEQSSAVFPY